MNLQELRMHRGFRPACYGCGVRMDHCAKVYADLHGPAFQAYYCTPCAQELRAAEVRAERQHRDMTYHGAHLRDAELMRQFARSDLTERGRMMLLSGLAGFDRTVGLDSAA